MHNVNEYGNQLFIWTEYKLSYDHIHIFYLCLDYLCSNLHMYSASDYMLDITDLID